MPARRPPQQWQNSSELRRNATMFTTAFEGLKSGGVLNRPQSPQTAFSAWRGAVARSLTSSVQGPSCLPSSARLAQCRYSRLPCGQQGHRGLIGDRVTRTRFVHRECPPSAHHTQRGYSPKQSVHLAVVVRTTVENRSPFPFRPPCLEKILGRPHRPQDPGPHAFNALTQAAPAPAAGGSDARAARASVNTAPGRPAATACPAARPRRPIRPRATRSRPRRTLAA
ncbi:hypothetical protein PHYC_00502 [Phycisphaerales bacterium]|nr:hypothetical protein PHYC_00502 [Phycisphaerales bacterium]